MMTDVIREVRAAREAFAAKHNYNLAAMFSALRKEQGASGHPVVSFAPRKPAPKRAAPARGARKK